MTIEILLPILYADAIELARKHNQVIGSKSDYYITLEQLESLMLKLRDDSGKIREMRITHAEI